MKPATSLLVDIVLIVSYYNIASWGTAMVDEG